MNNYVYYLWAALAERVKKLPEPLMPYLNRYQQLELQGDELTEENLAALLKLARQGRLQSLYMTPFAPLNQFDEPLRRRMINLWYRLKYTPGCAAAVLNPDCSVAYVHDMADYAPERRGKRQAGDETPGRPPLVFADYQQMAQAVENFLYTGSFDGSLPRPPAPGAECRGADPSLLFWLENSLGRELQSPADLAAIKSLPLPLYVPEAYPHYPEWLTPEPGNWSLLQDLPNLQSLFLPELKLPDFSFLARCSNLRQLGLCRANLADGRLLAGLKHLTMLELPAAEFGDFSFLQHMPQLEILDLSYTDFRDCRILAGLPNLRLVHLPAERQLLNLAVLEELPMQVKTYARRSRGRDIPPFDLIAPDEKWLAEHETLDIAPPYKVLYITVNGSERVAPEIDARYLQKLLNQVSEGDLGCVVASPEYWGEEDFMELDAADGWATLAWEDWDNDCWYTIYNPAEAGNLADAPPEIGGQSPVPKMHAVQDLHLAADCLAYFIKTGGLYPGAYWARYYK